MCLCVCVCVYVDECVCVCVCVCVRAYVCLSVIISLYSLGNFCVR